MSDILTFFLIIIFLPTFSCSSKENIQNQTVISSNEFVEIQIDKAEKKFDFNEIIDSIDLIELESPENQIIASCDKVISFENDLYILDKKQSIINKFSTSGKFIAQLTTLGKGPGEVTRISDFTVDEPNKEIIVFDKGSGILFMDLHGKFLRKTAFSPYPDRFEQISPNEMLFYNDYNYFKSDGPYNFSVVDKEGTLVTSFFDYPGGQVCLSNDFGGILSKCEDGVLCSNGLSSNIYRIRRSNSSEKKILIKKEYVFDLGDMGVPIEEDEVCEYFSRNYMNFEVSYMFKNFYETPNKSLIFAFVIGNKIFKGFFIKDKAYIADKSKKDVYNYLFELPVGISRNMFFAQVAYEDIYKIKGDKYLLEQLVKEKPTLATKIRSMRGENQGRQVIACVKLKE